MFFGIFISDIKYNILDNDDELEVNEKILNDLDDLDQFINSYFDVYDSYSYSLIKNDPIDVLNSSQTTLKNYYNNLGNNRFDLNGDKVIDKKDNLGQNGGICQPTAVAMLLQYMTYSNKISYYPRLNSTSTNINTVFYEVVDAYISNGWEGSGASRNLCFASLNTFFIRNNIYYSAKYSTKNLFSLISNSYKETMPLIGHITEDSSGHAVVISGYITAKIDYEYTDHGETYYDTSTWNFAVINTWWSDVKYGNINSQYYTNYSFIDVDFLDAVTYIEWFYYKKMGVFLWNTI